MHLAVRTLSIAYLLLFLNSDNDNYSDSGNAIGGKAKDYINDYKAGIPEMKKVMTQVYVQVSAGYAARTFYDVIDNSWDFLNMTGVGDWDW